MLRIEDTDLSRSSPEMEENILNGLRWLGLLWDGEPAYQSTHRPRHEQACRLLLQKGSAYPCFCDPEELKKMREAASRDGLEYRYEQTCLRLVKSDVEAKMRSDVPYAIRFRIPEGKTTFRDRIRGEVTVDHAEIDDFVMLRSDGSPVYQVAVVVDDHDMGITHVIRGDDHLSNTPKQILLYQALGWPVPEFAHVPMILGSDKKRLSKRHGATSIEEYRKQGFLPDALRNFLVLLGWSPGDDREILSLSEMVESFSLEAVSKKSAVFDEQKLAWMNQQYMQKLSDEALMEQVMPFLPSGTADPSTEKGKKWLFGYIRLMRNRVQKFSEFHEKGFYFFTDPQFYDPETVQKYWKDPSAVGLLDALVAELIGLSGWTVSEIEKSIRGLADRLKLKAGQLIHPARLALTGGGASPGIFELMELLGAETVIQRLKRAAEWIRQGEAGK